MAKSIDIIYGLHTVRHTLQQSPEALVEILLLDSKKITEELRSVSEGAKQFGISVQRVPRETLDRLAGSKSHQGVVARYRASRSREISDLDTLLLNNKDINQPLILILDGVQDPHNLGACLRTVDAVGANGVVIPKDKSVQVNPTVRKVASGGAEHTPVITVTNLARGMEKMQQAGLWLYGMAGDGDKSLYDIDLTGPVAIVLGGEGKGLRQNTRNHCDAMVHIPMLGAVESLNVSVAAAVCLYEVLRQRQYQQS